MNFLLKSFIVSLISRSSLEDAMDHVWAAQHDEDLNRLAYYVAYGCTRKAQELYYELYRIFPNSKELKRFFHRVFPN
jgi:hypothetical protein